MPIYIDVKRIDAVNIDQMACDSLNADSSPSSQCSWGRVPSAHGSVRELMRQRREQSNAFLRVLLLVPHTQSP